VIFYNRGNSRLPAEKLAEADRCANLIGFKDGVGDIEAMVRIRRKPGNRFAYLGGPPTAEVYAAAYRAMGVPVYLSGVGHNARPVRTSGGYPWTVITVRRRNEYMAALEEASVNNNIEPFAAFLAGLQS
jgi:hypothetical protein